MMIDKCGRNIMQVQFIGKNIEVTDALKSFTTDKMKSLEKRFAHISIVNIVFNVEHKSHIVEANIHIDSAEIHAHAEAHDMYAAIDTLMDKLLGQLTKHKEKVIDSHR